MLRVRQASPIPPLGLIGLIQRNDNSRNEGFHREELPTAISSDAHQDRLVSMIIRSERSFISPLAGQNSTYSGCHDEVMTIELR